MSDLSEEVRVSGPGEDFARAIGGQNLPTGEAASGSKSGEATGPPKTPVLDSLLDRSSKLFKLACWAGGCIAAIASIGALVVLIVAAIDAGRDAVSRNWAAGSPWFSGIEWAAFATPVTAAIAGAVAVTTARWGINSARMQRLADRTKWEEERDAINERHAGEQRDITERTLRDRFHELVGVLSSNDLRAREAAAYALAGLADDWNAHYRGADPARAKSEQQVCINVLIAQLRDETSELGRSDDSDPRVAFKRSLQRIISSRLSYATARTVEDGAWSNFDLDFSGCTLVDFSLEDQRWSGTRLSFDGARFVGKRTTFARFRSVGGVVTFDGATFHTNEISFENSEYNKTKIRFARTRFRGATYSPEGPKLSFEGIELDGELLFEGVQFKYMDVKLDRAVITGTRFSCADALLIGTSFSLDKSNIHSTELDLDRAYAENTQLSFDGATVSGGSISISDGHFIDSSITFDNAQLQADRFKVGDSHFWNSRLSFDSATVGSADVSMRGSFFHSTALVFNNANITSGEVDMSCVTADFSAGQLASLGDVRLNKEEARLGAATASRTDCETCLDYLEQENK